MAETADQIKANIAGRLTALEDDWMRLRIALDALEHPSSKRSEANLSSRSEPAATGAARMAVVAALGTVEGRTVSRIVKLTGLSRFDVIKELTVLELADLTDRVGDLYKLPAWLG